MQVQLRRPSPTMFAAGCDRCSGVRHTSKTMTCSATLKRRSPFVGRNTIYSDYCRWQHAWRPSCTCRLQLCGPIVDWTRFDISTIGQLAYHPWATPAIPTTLFGQQTTANPGATVPVQFHGTAAKNEHNDHGTYDSPEDTAQTSPATVAILVPIDGELNIARIQNLVQTSIYIGSTSNTVKAAVNTTGALHNTPSTSTKATVLSCWRDAS